MPITTQHVLVPTVVALSCLVGGCKTTDSSPAGSTVSGQKDDLIADIGGNPFTDISGSCKAELSRGQSLAKGEWLCDEELIAAFQRDGNFVVYAFATTGIARAESQTALFSANTRGVGATLTFQDDCNLVVRSEDGSPVWESRTSSPPGTECYLRVDEDDVTLKVLKVVSPQGHREKAYDVTLWSSKHGGWTNDLKYNGTQCAWGETPVSAPGESDKINARCGFPEIQCRFHWRAETGSLLFQGGLTTSWFSTAERGDVVSAMQTMVNELCSKRAAAGFARKMDHAANKFAREYTGGRFLVNSPCTEAKRISDYSRAQCDKYAEGLGGDPEQVETNRLFCRYAVNDRCALR